MYFHKAGQFKSLLTPAFWLGEELKRRRTISVCLESWRLCKEHTNFNVECEGDVCQLCVGERVVSVKFEKCCFSFDEGSVAEVN